MSKISAMHSSRYLHRGIENLLSLIPRPLVKAAIQSISTATQSMYSSKAQLYQVEYGIWNMVMFKIAEIYCFLIERLKNHILDCGAFGWHFCNLDTWTYIFNAGPSFSDIPVSTSFLDINSNAFPSISWKYINKLIVALV